jgi:ElaB/YqjD/DUF883 family membrane-anchored ribosome-binding protein
MQTETVVVKKNGTKKLDARLESLREDLNALQSDFKALPQDAEAAGSEQVAEAIRLTKSIADRAIRIAEQSAARRYGEVESWADDNLDSARERVREQPLSAILVSAGIGMALGALFLRL